MRRIPKLNRLEIIIVRTQRTELAADRGLQMLYPRQKKLPLRPRFYRERGWADALTPY